MTTQSKRTVAFALCGSFCSFAAVLPQLRVLTARKPIVRGRCDNNGPSAAQKAFCGQRHGSRADACGQQRHRGAGGRGDDERLGKPLRAERLNGLQGRQRSVAGHFI